MQQKQDMILASLAEEDLGKTNRNSGFCVLCAEAIVTLISPREMHNCSWLNKNESCVRSFVRSFSFCIRSDAPRFVAYT